MNSFKLSLLILAVVAGATAQNVSAMEVNIPGGPAIDVEISQEKENQDPFKQIFEAADKQIGQRQAMQGPAMQEDEQKEQGKQDLARLVFLQAFENAAAANNNK